MRSSQIAFFLATMKRNALTVLVLGIMLGLPAQLRADPFELSIAVPEFLIPLNGEVGTLTVYQDGSTTTTGFDALGSQSFELGAYSAGHLTLNLVFSGFPLGGDPITDAWAQLTLDDFDFLTDQVTSAITLTEMAILDTAGGVLLNIDLADYLPAGTTTTDDVAVVLDPIPLMPPLTGADFTDPFVLSFEFWAEAENTGSSRWVTNTTEGIIADLSLSLVTSVPEPSTGLLFLLGSGLTALYRRRRSSRKGEGGESSSSVTP